MRNTRLVSLGALLCCLSVAMPMPMPMSAQPSDVVQDPKAPDFGPSNLTHVRVTALEFTPFFSDSTGWAGGTGFTRYPTSLDSNWGAPIRLPGGALLKRFELDYCDTSTVGAHLSATLLECDNQGQNCQVFGSANSTNNGCNFAAEDTLNQRIDNYHHLYLVDAQFGAADGTNSLASVIFSYQLDVSPAPGTPTFGDVPPSDPAFQYIEALVASGITAGCSGGNYCPDAPLTRRQMAVFLAKALGLQWTNF